MTRLKPAPLALVLAAAFTAACKPADPAASATASTTALAASPRGASDEVIPGRLLITLTGETLDRNSAGDTNSTSCKLNPTATNESDVAIKSLHAEFTVRTVADGAALPNVAALTMPIAIAPGETQPAWGPMYLDNHRCESLSITLNPTLPGACKTASKKPCPAYALASTGIASAP